MSIKEDDARRAFQNYVNAATDLAESVKRNIQHDGVVDNETVLKLNEFIIASNEIADLPMDMDDNETDETLN